MSIYAVGDIQGCLDPLLCLLDEVNFDSSVDTLWSVGDCINRGPRCLDTGLPCDARSSTCGGRSWKCVAKGPGEDMWASTEIIAKRQAEMAWVRLLIKHCTCTGEIS